MVLFPAWSVAWILLILLCRWTLILYCCPYTETIFHVDWSSVVVLGTNFESGGFGDSVWKERGVGVLIKESNLLCQLFKRTVSWENTYVDVSTYSVYKFSIFLSSVEMIGFYLNCLLPDVKHFTDWTDIMSHMLKKVFFSWHNPIKLKNENRNVCVCVEITSPSYVNQTR